MTDKTKEINIGVVIPTKNRHEDLIRALESVRKQTYLPLEVIVVDQSATDKAHAEIKDFLKTHRFIDLKYIYNPALSGLTAAKNEAVKIAASDVLLFIDDDIVLDKNFLEVLSSVYKRYPELSGVGGLVRLPEGKTSALRRKIALIFQVGPFRDMRAMIQAGYLGNKEIVRTWLLSGGLSSLRREVFEKIRFDDNLIGASPIEDMDFYSKAKDSFQFALAPAARALHNVSPRSRSGLKRAFENKCLGFIFIFSQHVEKNFLNRLAFMWRNLGIFIDAIVSSVSFKTLDPVKGVFLAWKKSLSSG